MTKFKRSIGTNPYTLITPLTELQELEEFLKGNIFALGKNPALLVLGTNLTPGAQLPTQTGSLFLL